MPARVVNSAISHSLSRKGPSSSIAVQYSFVADGKEYLGSTYEYGVPRKHFGPDAERIVGEYLPGAATTAYYDPADPSRNALVLAHGHAAYSAVVLTAFLVVGALLWLFVGVPAFERAEHDEQTLLTYDAGRERNFVKMCREVADQWSAFVDAGEIDHRHQSTVELCIKEFGRDFDPFLAKGEQKAP